MCHGYRCGLASVLHERQPKGSLWPAPQGHIQVIRAIKVTIKLKVNTNGPIDYLHNWFIHHWWWLLEYPWYKDINSWYQRNIEGVSVMIFWFFFPNVLRFPICQTSQAIEGSKERSSEDMLQKVEELKKAVAAPSRPVKPWEPMGCTAVLKHIGTIMFFFQPPIWGWQNVGDITKKS